MWGKFRLYCIEVQQQQHCKIFTTFGWKRTQLKFPFPVFLSACTSALASMRSDSISCRLPAGNSKLAYNIVVFAIL